MTISKAARAIQINYNKEALKKFGILRLLWGADIFIHNVPVLKSFLLANIIVWIAMWVTK